MPITVKLAHTGIEYGVLAPAPTGVFTTMQPLTAGIAAVALEAARIRRRTRRRRSAG